MLSDFVDERLSHPDMRPLIDISETTGLQLATSLAAAAAMVCLTLGACVPACGPAALDALFGAAVQRRFAALPMEGAFLSALVPFVLADLLPALPPEVVRDMISRHADVGDGDAVERCVLHLDVGTLDFDQVARLCAQHGLHAALAHLYIRGLDDFVAPADAMLATARAEAQAAQAVDAQTPRVRPWHRLLLFLRESFRGRRFPPGRGALPPDRVPRLKAELLGWLLSDDTPADDAPYPRLRFLLACDAAATLGVLREAFDGWDAAECDVPITSLRSPADAPLSPTTIDAGRSAVQLVVEAVILAAELAAPADEEVTTIGGGGEEVVVNSARAACLGFAAAFVGSGRASAPGPVVMRLATALALGPPKPSARDARLREAELVSLLASCPEVATDARMLAVVKQASFRQAEALIHVALGDFTAALEAATADEEYAEGACDLARSLLTGAPGSAASPAGALLLETLPPPRAGGAAAAVRALDDPAAVARLRAAATDALPVLAHACPPGAALLVATCMPDGLGTALRRLGEQPEVQFAFLGALVGDRVQKEQQQWTSSGPGSTSSALAPLLQAVPPMEADAVCEAYLGLLCRYDKRAVAPFLARTAHCRLDAALRLVQGAGIPDAHALLLERAGRPREALGVLLSRLAEATHAMTFACARSDAASGGQASVYEVEVTQAAAADARAAVASALDDAVALCGRHSVGCTGLDIGTRKPSDDAQLAHPGGGDGDDGDADPDHPTSLWLTLLDAVLAPLRTHVSPPSTSVGGDSAGAALRASLQRLLLSMRSAIPPSVLATHVVKTCRADTGFTLGTVRAPLLGALAAAAAHRAVFRTAAAAVAADTATNNASALAHHRRAVPAAGVDFSLPEVAKPEGGRRTLSLPVKDPASQASPRGRRSSLPTPPTPPRVKR